MIQLALPHVFLVLVAAHLAVVFVCWMFYAGRHAVPRSAAGERVYRCSVCSHVYVDGREVPLSRCPRCGCLNEAVKR